MTRICITSPTKCWSGSENGTSGVYKTVTYTSMGAYARLYLDDQKPGVSMPGWTWTTACVLPEKFRPAHEHQYVIPADLGGPTCAITIATDGVVTIMPRAGGMQTTGMVMIEYPLD